MALASGVDVPFASTETASSKERGFESHFDQHFCVFCSVVQRTKVSLRLLNNLEQKRATLNELERTGTIVNISEQQKMIFIVFEYFSVILATDNGRVKVLDGLRSVWNSLERYPEYQTSGFLFPPRD